MKLEQLEARQLLDASVNSESSLSKDESCDTIASWACLDWMTFHELNAMTSYVSMYAYMTSKGVEAEGRGKVELSLIGGPVLMFAVSIASSWYRNEPYIESLGQVINDWVLSAAIAFGTAKLSLPVGAGIMMFSIGIIGNPFFEQWLKEEM